MPIGIQRLNDPHPQPSSQVVFIKPLKGSGEAYAKDFLERVAAICHPIMKANHLSVMTLEEHEPNTEFVGRNFNAGEIVQLVLKSHRTGQWLSFRTVQLVMVHELAHIMQMNHSKKFWQVRNQYANELRTLWQKGYTGDGKWGRGRTLLSGRYDSGRRPEEDQLPEHLCGGVYRRSRRKKRRRNGGNLQPATYAEKKQRRIEKKFGKVGQSLGGDLDTRTTLENGQAIRANPRVANSSRGRELRVAAALARFEGQKHETSKDELVNLDEKSQSDSATSDSDEDSEEVTRICGSEDLNDQDVKHELEDLQNTGAAQRTDQQDQDSTTDDSDDDGIDHAATRHDQEPSERNEQQSVDRALPPASLDKGSSCAICSMDNIQGSTLCIACSHVLDPSRVQGSWSCENEICISSGYLNAGDCGLCGVCGSRRPGQS